MKKINMIGKKFGKLTIIAERKERNRHGQLVYKCQCDCGNVINAIGFSLRYGHTKSCGCLKGEKHGKSYTRLYHIFKGMKERCYNINTKHYKIYGGRGITICDEWLDKFMNFYNWAIDNGYKKGLTIDRIDVNGNYEPNNCRWVDQKIQANNRRSNVYLTYNGKTQTITRWSEELKCNRSTIYMRHRKGWNNKECLFGRE